MTGRTLLVTPAAPWGDAAGFRIRLSMVLEGLARLGPVDVCVLHHERPPQLAAAPPAVERAVWLPVSEVPGWRWRAPIGLAGPERMARLGPVPDERADDAAILRAGHDLTWCVEPRGFEPVRSLARRPLVLDLQNLHDWVARHGSAAPRSLFDRAGPPGSGTARAWHGRRLARRWEHWQREAAAAVDAVVVCSELDAERLSAPNQVVIPNAYPTIPARPRPDGAPDRLRVALVGTLQHEPNRAGARFLAREVLPRLRDAVPAAEVVLVGARPDLVADLASIAGVQRLGHVTDLDAVLADIDVVTAPIFAGGGTRLKVLEGFARGIPVVATTVGAEGLDVVDGEDVLIADSPDGFAAAVLALHRNPARGAALVQRAAERDRGHDRWGEGVDAVERLARTLAGTRGIEPVGAGREGTNHHVVATVLAHNGAGVRGGAVSELEGVTADPGDERDESIALVPDVIVGGRVRATFAVDASSDDPISQWLLTQKGIDEPPIQLALDLLSPGDRFLDVGAHIGTYSLAAAAHGCEVLGVEGSPSNARLLRAAARANRFEKLRIVNAVASAEAGEVDFVAHGPWGYVPLPGHDDDTRDRVHLPAVRLSDLVEQAGWDHVDFMKMDIEGSEPVALAGMEDLLRRDDRPTMMIESNATMLVYAGSSPRDMLQFLADCGYELYLLDRQHHGRLIKVQPDTLQVDCVADYLACTSYPQLKLAHWTVSDGFDPGELVGYFSAAAADHHAQYRTYTTEVLRTAPAAIREDPELVAVRAALALDPDAGVRAAAATLDAEPADAADRSGPRARRTRRSVDVGPAPAAWPAYRVLARRDLVVRYHRSLLGMGWSVLGPLLTVGALWAILSQVFETPRFEVPYIVYLLSGMTVLTLAAQTLQQVGQCLVASEALRAKLRVSPRVVALAGTASIMTYSSVLFGALLVLQVVTGVGIPVTAPLAIVVLALLLATAIGAGMVVAAIAVRVNDALAALAVFVQVLGYMTPTFYPIEVVPQPWRHVVQANPLTHFLTVFRAVVFEGELGPPRSWVVVVLSTVVAVGAGMTLFDRSARLSVGGR